jgi:anthranilate synthase component II
VVVDHYDSYTYNLVHLVAEVTGVLPAVVQHDETTVGEVLEHDFVLLSPGPGHPADPHDFAVGTQVLRIGTRPVLGVCLGLQGMVTAWGGEVTRVPPAHGRVARIGHDGRGLFTGLPQGFEAVRYHSLAATRLPEQLVATAYDSDDGTVMGVRHRDLPQQGVQFHPESILSRHGADLVRNFLEQR